MGTGKHGTIKRGELAERTDGECFQMLYELLCSIRSESMKARGLAGKLLTQNDVDAIDRIGDIANKLVGRVINEHDSQKQSERFSGSGI